MHSRAVQVILLILSLVLAIIILIASSKYAAWSREMTKASGSWLTLVFYVGAIPLFSLVYTASHLAALQFNGLPTPPYAHDRDRSRGGRSRSRSMILFSSKSNNTAGPYDADYASSTTFFILAVSIMHVTAWLAQAALCTGCELAPILAGTQGTVPKWCPQSRFQDTRQPGLAGMLATLATAKDFLQWAMVVLAAVLVECARREYMRAEHVRREDVRMAGAGVDFGGGARAGAFPAVKSGGGAGGVVVELTQISGPRLFRPEEEAREQERQRQRQHQQRKMETERDRPLPPQPPQPTGPGAPGNRDNYYGNGMGLKRSGTLNYMYESRV